MEIQAIFFDLDDTLHDSRRPFEKALKSIKPEITNFILVESIYKKFREFSDVLWNRYCNNELTLEELRIQRITLALQCYDTNIDNIKAKEFQRQYDKHLSNIELFPYVPVLLEKLNNSGVLLGIITNGPVQHQMSKIETLGLTTYIPKELIFISDEVGAAKPQPEIYHYASKKIGISPTNLLYIGDSWLNDVAGAKLAGWNSIWFNHRKRIPSTNHQPFAEIIKLPEILSILDI